MTQPRPVTSFTKPSDGETAPSPPSIDPPYLPPTSRDDAGHDAPVSDAVLSIAARSTSPTDFLRRIAAQWTETFSLAAVALAHPDWPRPMMVARDAEFGRRLDADFIDHLLTSSRSAATACDLPLRRPETQSLPDDNLPASPLSDETPPAPTRSSDPPDRARGMHIRLSPQSDSCAALLIYGNDRLPDTATQIRDLKRLADHARCCRVALEGFDNDRDRDSFRSTLPLSDSTRALRHFHQDLDLTGTAYRIANETRRLLSLDRVTVLASRRGRLRVESVSGVAVVDRRANAIAAATTLATRVLVLGRPITLPAVEPLPPQIADPLDHYLEATDVASVLVVPLYRPSPSALDRGRPGKHRPSDIADPPPSSYTDDQYGDAEPIAVMLLESFSDADRVRFTPAMGSIAAEAAVALSNAREHQRIFGLRVLKTLGDWFGGNRLSYSTLGLLTAAASLLAASIIQVDHTIIATGFVEPAEQQNVFARSDGIVKQIFVRDGQPVAAGDVLMRLENADLETQAESLSGEIQTTLQRLTSIGSMLLDPATDKNLSQRMAIEQRQLQSELNHLQGQQELVRRQLSELEITAPIDGVVAAWQLKRKLSGRPIGRGNQLLSIVRTDGPWQLRLEIPDQDAAEVARARATDDELRVEFAAASHPESTFSATLQSIAGVARRNGQGRTVIDAEATVDPRSRTDRASDNQFFASADAHNGVDATAKIHCGRRSLLASWFGDVADFVHRNLLFYVR
ncbi:efflux RND transporter periplasmic adaptor subunit [Stieleria mannarensis]|uniref:efflux RND transporter periplasmic adaptor subunit n=1 Tax=Stieleria mannarensis TaxID=2755585 RepID=UPI0016001C7C|nr:efflux RND transporter periplasmic adaptor subunit [Rhodopirellula sp. JC639]